MLRRSQVASIGELFDAVRSLRRLWNPHRGPEELWFRGDKKPYPLLPSLYRSPNVQRYDEASLLEAFRALATPLMPAATDDWDWYFLARHHGLPTRLLDWSTNLVAALYFALEPHMRMLSRHEIDGRALRRGQSPAYDDECPVVWVLEACTLNAWSVHERALLSPTSNLNSLLPESLGPAPGRTSRLWPNVRPVAIAPRHSNTRLVAQGGRFTLHGRQLQSLDAIARQVPRVCLACIAVSREHLSQMWDDLETAGVNAWTVMKDLDSLAAHLRYSFDQSGGFPDEKNASSKSREKGRGKSKHR